MQCGTTHSLPSPALKAQVGLNVLSVEGLIPMPVPRRLFFCVSHTTAITSKI